MASPKRSISSDSEDERHSKRARVTESQESSSSSELSDILDQAQGLEINIDPPSVVSTPSLHNQSRSALQRSLAIVLQHDGFRSATPEALESFTQLVETYMESLINGAKSIALSSRREHPIPTDFEKTLRRHNVPISSLKVHLGLTLPLEQITPSYVDSLASAAESQAPLPLLSTELSGQPEKEEKLYIPATFPSFPSKHTYKFTPQDDVNVRDSKKIREQAARTAQHGEDALRRLVRASKMRKQKEVKSLVEKDRNGKERFRLWELTMKRFMGMEGRGEHTDQVEIADHSMIVNSDANLSRKEVSRASKRSAPLANGSST